MKDILIVDDHEMMRKFLSTFLSRTFNVEMAEDGIEALEYLKNNSAPALIVADIDMPRMDGYDFLNEVKSKPELKDIPVLILSSKSKSENRIKAYSLGAVDVLNKPFNPKELEMKIKNIGLV
ncbi:MAG: response regulator [Bacteroidia bacterium]